MIARPMTSIALATLLLLTLSWAISQAAHAHKSDDHSGKDQVMEACGNISARDMRRDKMHFTEEACLSALHSDNRTAIAKDHSDLVVVALDLLSNRGSEVAKKVNGVVLRSSHTSGNWTERVFRFCAADYGVLVNRLPVCRDMFLELKPLGEKVLWIDAMNVLECVDWLGAAATDCLSWLVNKDYKQTGEFEEVVKHASLAWGLMEMAFNNMDDDTSW